MKGYLIEGEKQKNTWTHIWEPDFCVVGSDQSSLRILRNRKQCAFSGCDEIVINIASVRESLLRPIEVNASCI